MAHGTSDNWNPDFPASCPLLYAPVSGISREIAKRHHDHWPELKDYQRVLDKYTGKITTHSGASVKFVPQAARASSFQEQYEPRIYLRGEVQTRRHNWHDFFQVLVWSAFPDTKKTINALHYVSAQQRLNEKGHTNRSPTENMLALFDECGAVLLSSDPALLKMIRNFEWHELFWLNREKLLRSLRCIVFGHAMYEKALNPYIGMTAPSLLFHVDQEAFNLETKALNRTVDQLCHNLLENSKSDLHPGILHPFPLLGMPGWHADNHNKTFYNDRDYFRNKRRKITQP